MQPSNSSGCRSTSHCAPNSAVSSSSAVNASTTSRRGRTPSRAHWLTTASSTASAFFMSTAPRPHSTPSRISPANGGTLQDDGSAGTTSRCPCTSSAGAPGSRPPTRATTFARPGADSSSAGSTPASASLAATYSAAGRSRPSPPPRLVVSILIRSAANRAASVPAGVIGAASSEPRHRIRRPGGAGRPRGTRRRSGAWW